MSCTQSKPFTNSTHTDQALAGFGAGLVSTAILHPLDVIKIRFQVDPLKHSTNQPFIGGTIRSFKDIVHNEGIVRGLYRGVAPSISGAAVSWGFYFWWYSFIKKQMKTNEGRLAAWQHLIASAEAGALTVVASNPIWVIKTRMCATTRTTPNAYKGLWDGLTRLGKEEGMKGLYRGMVPALFGVTHGAIQFTSYEEMKKWRNDLRHSLGETPKHELNAKLTTTEYLTMAMISKVIATVTTYPYQVLRSRFMNYVNKDEYRGLADCVKKIKSAEGYVGFYKGLAPSVIRVLPGTCLTFLVYENLTQFFKENAT
ncbi:unnamed protein product [Absidia cylindrospora]